MDQLKRHIQELQYQLEWFLNTHDTMGMFSEALAARCSRLLCELNQPTINWSNCVLDLLEVMREVPFQDQAPHAWFFATGITTCLDPDGITQRYWKPEFRARYVELTLELGQLIMARAPETGMAQSMWLRMTALNQAAMAIHGTDFHSVQH